MVPIAREILVHDKVRFLITVVGLSFVMVMIVYNFGVFFGTVGESVSLVARALANNPRVILADEPTGNLDSNAGRIVVELLKRRAREQNSGVVIVTHDNRIVDVADRVLYLVDGLLASKELHLPAWEREGRVPAGL